MPYICPVCNAFQPFHVHCPSCGQRMDDYGRLETLFGPYTPYQEIDGIKETNGYRDLVNHQCMHVAICPDCYYEEVVAVNERDDIDL